MPERAMVLYGVDYGSLQIYDGHSTELINAHIVPRGFARDIKGDHPHNLKISLVLRPRGK